MTRLLPAFGLALLIGSGSALASTHSDYTKSFPLQSLKTYAFKDQRRISRDPLANNGGAGRATTTFGPSATRSRRSSSTSSTRIPINSSGADTPRTR